MNNLISYAQNFEDVMLWRALRHVEGGRYVDIGAQSPDVDSVSKLFYDHGWRGVHVEPMPEYANALRADRPDEVVIQAAVASEAGIIPFYAFSDTGLSTTDPEIAEKHLGSGFEGRQIDAVAVTLDELLARFAKDEDVHWLKIDVEGGELAVLKSWKTSSPLPWILLIESTLPLTDIEAHEDWEPVVLAKGYRFAYFDGLNRFYISPEHPELHESFKTGPNLFDGFALSGKANSPLCSNLNEEIREFRAEAAAAAEVAATQLSEARRLREESERSAREVISGVEHRLEAALEQQIALSTELTEATSRELAQAKISAEIQAENLRLQHASEVAKLSFMAKIRELTESVGAAEALSEERARHIEVLRNQSGTLSGRVTELESLIQEAGAELGRERANVAQARSEAKRERELQDALLSRLRSAIASRRDEALAAREELMRHREEAHRWWQAAEAFRQELDRMGASYSWRMTSPLRTAARKYVASRGSAKQAVRGIVVWILRKAFGAPALAYPARLAIRRLPTARHHLLALAKVEGISVEAPSGPLVARPDSRPGLSLDEARVLKDLRQAIEEAVG